MLTESGKAGIIFVKSKGWLGRLISWITKSPYTHVAIRSQRGYIVESIGEAVNGRYPGVWCYPPNKYNDKNSVTVWVDVPNIKKAEDYLCSVIGKFYGYPDLISGGVYALTGIDIPGNGEKTMDCSELGTRYLRNAELDILPGINADSVSPGLLYKAIS